MPNQAKKPSNLIYGVNETPPFTINLLLGLQHTTILFIALVIPVMVIRLHSDIITPEMARNFISMSILAGGVITIIQALKKGPVGSGYLCPSLCGPSYFDASKMAIAAGGLPLLFGMNIFGGFLEVLFSRIMHKLRFLFPAEVTGVVVTMVGIVVIPSSMRYFLGFTGENPVLQPIFGFIGAFTLAIIIVLNVYSKGKAKLFCVLIGMVIGYAISLFLGIVPQSDINRLTSARLFQIPSLRHVSWRFDPLLIIPFAIATICSSFKTVGDLVTCQKINDAAWKRPDMKSVAGGILADGMGGLIPGLIGGFGQSTSSSNIGLSIATAATSRSIAYSAGGIFICAAFLPKLAEVFLIMPSPVIGATLIFSVSFMIVAGLQIIMSRMMDARKTFIVGASIIFGLSVDAVPGLYSNIHPWLQPIFNSSLSLATISAILLNLILRIGIAQQKTLSLQVGVDSSEKIFNFMEKQGRLWGARHEVIYRAISAMNEFLESAPLLELKSNIISMDVKFDELNLDIFISYQGKPLKIQSHKPTKEEILSDETETEWLSGYLINEYTDKITIIEMGEKNKIRMHFDH